MSKEKIEEFENALLEFIKRSTKEGATAEEVEALPAVANLVARISGLVIP